MAIEVYFAKEIRGHFPETTDEVIAAAQAAVEAYDGFEDIPVVTQHVIAFVECVSTVTDEFKAACVAADQDAIYAGIEATDLSDAHKEYLKGRVALDFE
jgi:hypothetical protein